MATLTPKGAATRARIVEAAADLVLARGVGGTSLDDIRAGTSTSKSQLFHYFPRGKGELVGEIAALQSARVMAAQEPYLSSLDDWEGWRSWRDALVGHYASQEHSCCPIGALVNELVASDPVLASDVAVYMEQWRAKLQGAVERTQAAGLIGAGADAETLGLATFAALHGGLLLMHMMDSVAPLEAALDGALAALRSAA